MSMWTGSISDEAMKECLFNAQLRCHLRYAEAIRDIKRLTIKDMLSIYLETGNIIVEL
jgi:hypothetical protein